MQNVTEAADTLVLVLVSFVVGVKLFMDNICKLEFVTVQWGNDIIRISLFDQPGVPCLINCLDGRESMILAARADFISNALVVKNGCCHLDSRLWPWLFFPSDKIGAFYTILAQILAFFGDQ